MDRNIHCILPDEDVNREGFTHPDVKMGRIAIQKNKQSKAVGKSADRYFLS